MLILVQLCGALSRIALIPAFVMIAVLASGQVDQLTAGVAGLIEAFEVLS